MGPVEGLSIDLRVEDGRVTAVAHGSTVATRVTALGLNQKIDELIEPVNEFLANTGREAESIEVLPDGSVRMRTRSP